MITVQLLEINDKILPTDWCRPLTLVSMNGGYSDSYSFESEYSGNPINNAKWCKVSDIFGETWFNSTVRQINKIGQPYEFIRGDIPKTHLYGKTRKNKHAEYENYLDSEVRVGKYNGKTIRWIRNYQESYFDWGVKVGMFKLYDEYQNE